MLYVVGTPIGNLEDITLRALRVLSEVALVAAEDTRSARVLLRHHGISTPVTSFHDFTSAGKEHGWIASIQVNGTEVSPNLRGYNVVVVDPRTNTLIITDIE